jgi:type II secretory pathway component PulC
LAFIDDSDLRAAEPKDTPQSPQPQIIYQPAPRGKLVPVLLVILIIAVVAVGTVMALPYIRTAQTDDKPEVAHVDIADLDPATLVTPTGRKLDVVQLNGYVFEITRIAYSDNVRARTVTITVPDKPPQMGVFHVNESFADGKIRIVDISSETVTLESDGKQKMFTVPGADPSAIWDRAPSGMQIVPPTETGAVPDIPTGVTRPPKNPMADHQPTETDNPRHDWKTIDDIPYEEERILSRTDYQKLVRELPEVFENDMILHKAFERETRAPNGLEIKNIKVGSKLYNNGLQRGDVVTRLNDQQVFNYTDLITVARGGGFGSEIRIEVQRDSGAVTFVFKPGVPK